ncbi:MAG TPA: hypothetical protein VN688_05645 [Gemmataceae bacterium]|nr:hypothetical protein [Gemmataceae bacterium]
MSRTLRLLFRRDPSRDRQTERVRYEGYEFLWPDGRPVTLGLDAFCQHGQRLLGLGKHLAGAPERLVDMLCFPLPDAEAPLTRLPGHRVRRFSIQRHDRQGRLYFLDGTPTTIVLDLDHDESAVLHWIGLSTLNDGERQWFDIAARPAELAAPTPARPPHAFGTHALSHEVVS